MLTIDVIAYVFYTIIFAGTLMLASKRRFGWVLRVIGDLGWAYIGYEIGLTSALVFGIIFAGNDALGWWRWRR